MLRDMFAITVSNAVLNASVVSPKLVVAPGAPGDNDASGLAKA
jgi:hypothetical protein